MAGAPSLERRPPPPDCHARTTECHARSQSGRAQRSELRARPKSGGRKPPSLAIARVKLPRPGAGRAGARVRGPRAAKNRRRPSFKPCDRKGFCLAARAQPSADGSPRLAGGSRAGRAGRYSVAVGSPVSRVCGQRVNCLSKRGFFAVDLAPDLRRRSGITDVNLWPDSIKGLDVQIKELLRNLNLGNSVAEFDQDLKSYFVETQAFRELVSGDKDIIAGDKGTGKTALYKVLKERAWEFPQLRDVEVVSAFNPSGNPVFQRLGTIPVLTEGQYVTVWKGYILSLLGNGSLSSWVTRPRLRCKS